MQCNTRISAKGTTYKPMHNTAVRQPQKTNIKIIVCTVLDVVGCCCCCGRCFIRIQIWKREKNIMKRDL